MKFIGNILEETRNNSLFSKVWATGKNSLIVLMSIPAEKQIGEEVHWDTDQAVIFVKGKGIAVLDGDKIEVKEGDMAFIPAGTLHNFKNTNKESLKFFTIYSPSRNESYPKLERKLSKREGKEEKVPDVANWNFS